MAQNHAAIAFSLFRRNRVSSCTDRSPTTWTEGVELLDFCAEGTRCKLALLTLEDRNNPLERLHQCNLFAFANVVVAAQGALDSSDDRI